jgi:uncharacterized membrane protein YeaQ/YmgE (transglycosylase-associated protein family)
MNTIGAIISWAVFGLVVGAIARFLVPGRQNMSLIMTMILGIVGSLLGGVVASLFARGEIDATHPAGWIMSIIGAILVVWIYAASTGRRHTV